MERIYDEDGKAMQDMFWRGKSEPSIKVKPIPNIMKDKEERISCLVKELKQRDGQYKELLEENERLERKLKWADENLIEKLIELSRYRKLVDDLMKTISLLINRVEGHE